MLVKNHRLKSRLFYPALCIFAFSSFLFPFVATSSPALAASARCAREFDNGSVQDASCDGYSLDGKTQYPFAANKCYYIKALQNGPPAWDIQEVSCSSYESLLKDASSNHQGTCDDAHINKDNCGIVAYLVDIINVLSGLVGIVVLIMIAVGGVQYITARDNPQQTAAAKTRIRDAILALVMYLFIFSFLQWLVPGGLF